MKRILLLIPIYLLSVWTVWSQAPAAAKINPIPVAGCAPLGVSFGYTASGGAATSWSWDFGGVPPAVSQSTGNTPSAAVFYTQPGTYTITLTISNASGSSVATPVTITVFPAPVADFNVSKTTGCFPTNIDFTDNSGGGGSGATVVSWLWDFGDGVLDSIPNPSHLYTRGGNFLVSLYVKNSYGCRGTASIKSVSGAIQLSNGVIPNFSTALQNTCQIPIDATFTNQTTGPANLSYVWDFGDGSPVSNAVSPVHNYTTAGNYNVKLVATSDKGCGDTLYNTVKIASSANVSSFDAPSAVCINTPVTFPNTSSPYPNASSWDYGDGSPADPVRDGAHTFTAAGTYHVTLTNTFSNCTGSVTHDVQVVTQPTTDFTGANVNGCKPPLTVSFTDQSVGATSWLWNFGDGTTSTLQNPQHNFTNYNSYNVTLTTSSAGGCSSSKTKTAFVNITKPIVSIPTLPGYGCAPFTFNPSISVTAVDGIASYLWDFGNGTTSTAASPPAQVYGTGNYNVSLTITTNGGCTATTTGIVKVGSVKPVSDFTASPTSVCVKTNVQFSDLSTGGANQWLWDFGDGATSTIQNPGHSYQKPGTFTVKLIAYNDGCFLPVPKTLSIVVNPPLADFSYAFNCASRNTVSFKDASTGAASWDWDFGDLSPHYTGGPTPPAHVYAAVGPTDFTITLTVTNGSCTDVISKKITVNQSSTLSVSANPVCNSSTVVFTAKVPAYVTSYVYDFGDGTVTGPMTGSVSHVYPVPGNYNVTLTTTDNTGCVEPVLPPLVMQISGPTVKFTSSSQQFCGTAASPTFPVQFTDQSTPSPGSSIAKWEWDFGDGQKSTAQSPSHTYVNEGIYTVRLRVTDVLGCVDSLLMPSYITFSKPVAKFTTADVNYCPSSQIKFTNASGSAFNPVYTWDFGDGSAPFTGANPPSHNYPLDGDYTVKLSMTDSYGCTSSFDNAAAPIHIDHPVAGFTVDNTFSSCPPLTAHFTFTGSYAKTYIWSFGDGVTSNNPTTSHVYTFPGDYVPTLTIISPGGCSDQFTGPNIHIEGPVGQFEYSPLGACNDINVNFKVTTANVVQFTWLYGDGTPPEVTSTSTTVHEYKNPGVYIPGVILKDATGCEVPYPGSQKIVVDGITKTEFTADKTVLCDNGTINFKDASVLGFGTIVNTYVWDFGDGSAPVAGMNPTISHAFNVVGTYNVKLTITTVNGCADQFTMPIEVAASPQIDIGGLTPQCEPATLNFTGIELVPDPNGPLSWAWDFGNGQTSTVQNPPAVLYPKAGSYNVSLRATNTKGCSTTYPAAPSPLLIYKIPAVDAGKDMTVCLGGPDFQLNATGDIGNAYTWETPVNGTLSCLACAGPMANSPVSTYFVVSGLSPFGCQANDTVNITVNMPVTVTVSGPDSVCLGQSAQLTASGAAIYEWTPADGLSDPAIANPVSTPTSSMLGTDLQKVIPYQVTGWDNIKCFQDTKTINITAFNYPKVDVGADVTIPVGSSYQINGTGSADIVSLSWTPTAALSCTNCLSPLATPIKTTTYVLNAVNDGTCATSDSIKITVICNNGNFFIPNTFSPNGDGSNDRFIVRGKGLNIIPSITIFNRWGQVVFEKRNFAPNDAASGWDGTFNGKPAPSDVYIYTIQILCDNATLIPYHGNVTLIR